MQPARTRKCRLLTAGGHKLPVLGSTHLNLTLQNWKTTLDALVIETSPKPLILGINFYKISSQYFWDGLYKDVTRYIRGCQSCQARKGKTNQKPAGLLQPISVGLPFEKIGIDLVGPIRTSLRQIGTSAFLTSHLPITQLVRILQKCLLFT